MNALELAARVHTAAEIAVRAAGEDLMARAVHDAPVEEGTLRASASLEVHDGPTGPTAVVAFDTPYAARQHEETTWKHPRGGRSKYLESNLTGMASEYRRVLTDAMRRALR
jgi:hypothetical protein